MPLLHHLHPKLLGKVVLYRRTSAGVPASQHIDDVAIHQGSDVGSHVVAPTRIFGQLQLHRIHYIIALSSEAVCGGGKRLLPLRMVIPTYRTTDIYLLTHLLPPLAFHTPSPFRLRIRPTSR